VKIITILLFWRKEMWQFALRFRDNFCLCFSTNLGYNISSFPLKLKAPLVDISGCAYAEDNGSKEN